MKQEAILKLSNAVNTCETAGEGYTLALIPHKSSRSILVISNGNIIPVNDNTPVEGVLGIALLRRKA